MADDFHKFLRKASSGNLHRFYGNLSKEIKSENSSEVNKNEPTSNKEGIPSQLSDVKNLSSGDSTVYDSLKDLSSDFHSVMSKDIFTDVTIECGSDVIRAHKIVLCARSSVFEAMFTSPMQESKNDTVAIDDIDVSVLRTMLEFMYSGQVKALTLSTSCDLLYAAEKYQIKALKRTCVQYLWSHISDENVFQILQCAHLYDKQLKSDVISHISEKFSALKETEDWKKLQSSNPALAVEVYSKAFDKILGKK